MIEEDEIEQEEDVPAKKTIDRKKMLIFILPVLIVIGLSVGFYYALNSDYGGNGAAQYNVVKHTPSADGAEKISVFYDLPEVSVNLKSSGPDRQRLHLRINIELSSIEDIKIVEILTPKLNDAILSHIVELIPQELEGANGLHWLKEELLYRLNLVVAPIKISNLNIKSMEIKTENHQ